MQLNLSALIALQERTGLSTSALAQLAGISQPHLTNIRLGHRNASDKVIIALANSLQVPVTAITSYPVRNN